MSGLRKSFRGRTCHTWATSLAVACGVVLALSGGASAQGWFDAAWQYRIKITIDQAKVSASQTNVPVLVLLSSITGAHPFWTNVEDGGGDLVVAASDGTARLPLEVVSCDATGTTGEIWFKGDLSASADTEFFLYYGNAAATQPAASDTYGSQNVWGSSYAGVWHFNETSGTHSDSTANGNDATVAAGSSVDQSATGKMGGADAFDDTSDSLKAADAPSLDITGTLTIEAWVYPNASTDHQMRVISKRETVNQNCYAMFFRATSTSGDDIGFRVTTVYDDFLDTESDGEIGIGQWSYLVITYDETSGTVNFYINGGLDTTVASFTQVIGTNDQQLDIGGVEGRDSRTFIGTIDEPRISNVARDADYIATQHNMMIDQAAFWKTIGSEEVQSGGPVLTTIEVTPDTAAVAPGDTQGFTAAAKDQNGQPISVTITWSVNATYGTVSPTTGNSTTFTSNGTEGTFDVTASSGSVQDTAQVMVSSATVLTTINVTPATASIQPSGTQDFTAEALDQYGSPMVVDVTWSITPAGGTFSPTSGTTDAGTGETTTTFTSDGTENTFTVKAASGGVEGTATLTVAQLVLTTITVSPGSAEIEPGESKSFAATARDQNGDVMFPTINWTVSGGGTLSNATGSATTFTSDGTEGSFTLTASSGGISKAVSIRVGLPEELTGVARGEGCVAGAAASGLGALLLVAALAAGVRRRGK